MPVTLDCLSYRLRYRHWGARKIIVLPLLEPQKPFMHSAAGKARHFHDVDSRMHPPRVLDRLVYFEWHIGKKIDLA